MLFGKKVGIWLFLSVFLSLSLLHHWMDFNQIGTIFPIYKSYYTTNLLPQGLWAMEGVKWSNRGAFFFLSAALETIFYIGANISLTLVWIFQPYLLSTVPRCTTVVQYYTCFWGEGGLWGGKRPQVSLLEGAQHQSDLPATLLKGLERTICIQPIFWGRIRKKYLYKKIILEHHLLKFLPSMLQHNNFVKKINK